MSVEQAKKVKGPVNALYPEDTQPFGAQFLTEAANGPDTATGTQTGTRGPDSDGSLEELDNF